MARISLLALVVVSTMTITSTQFVPPVGFIVCCLLCVVTWSPINVHIHVQVIGGQECMVGDVECNMCGFSGVSHLVLFL